MCYTQALYYNYAAACFVGVSELNKKNKRAKTFKNGEIKIKKIYINKPLHKVKATLEQATKAQGGSRCTALLFLQPRR